jgi:probable F420-dependent oxidoreductase
MKFGLFAMNYGACGDPEVAVTIAQYAEAAGFESLWTGEHIVLPDPQPVDFAIAPDLPMLDTVAALTLLAANTTSVKLASGIIILPLHHPVVLAKALASVDVVSDGRLIVGVGAGYVPAEFAAVGVPMARRGERMDDYVRVLRALWSMDRPQHDGPFVSFAGVDARPRPVQQPGPPIVVGGVTPGALRRAVTMANGWYVFNVDAALARECVEALRQTAEHHERPSELGRLELTMTPVGRLDRDVVDHYEELGVDRLVLLPQPDVERDRRHLPVPAEQIMRNIDLVADTLIRR